MCVPSVVYTCVSGAAPCRAPTACLTTCPVSASASVVRQKLLEGSATPEGWLCNTAHWGKIPAGAWRWDTSRSLLLARSPRLCDTLALQKCQRIAGRNMLECGPKNRSVNPMPKVWRWVWHPSTRLIRTRSSCEIFDAEEPFTPRGCIAPAWSVAEMLHAG